MQRGSWKWHGGYIEGGGGDYTVELDHWWIIPPPMVDPEQPTDERYPASRVNEPGEGATANAFSMGWFERGQLLAEEVGKGRGGRVVCLALHAGREGIEANSEILWHYGDRYSRGRYKEGLPCKAMDKAECETPAAYFRDEALVPRDAFREEGKTGKGRRHMKRNKAGHERREGGAAEPMKT